MVPKMTRVVHCKREPYDVYIGRPSKWGNPFALGKENARSAVIERYRAYLKREVEMGRLDPGELRGKVLGCWCAPKPCHGDILVEFAESESK